MSENEREKRAQAIREATNDSLRGEFATQIGQKAVVERSVLKSDERTEQLGEVLCDLGRDFLATGKAPKGMEYWGSFAIHVYASPVTGTFANIKQIRQGKIPDELLIRAADDLRSGVLEYVGRRPQKLRSGF